MSADDRYATPVNLIGFAFHSPPNGLTRLVSTAAGFLVTLESTKATNVHRKDPVDSTSQHLT